MTQTATTAETFTREQAKAADLALYNALEALGSTERLITWAQASIDHIAGREKVNKWAKKSPMNMTAQEAVDKVIALQAEESYIGSGAREAIARMREAIAKVEAAKAVVKAEDKWAENGRWNRYSVVPGGHIHTSFNGDAYECHTLRPSTDVRWAHPVSGDSVEEAIEVYGATLCSHCFPEAPVEMTGGKVAVDADGNPLTQAQKEAQEAAKAAKMSPAAKAKAAKADCAGSGTWDYPAETARKGYCAGNYGVCSHCNEAISISSTGKMRKHKAK